MPNNNAKPRYDVLVADAYQTSSGEEKVNWIRVGVAFPHGDGEGFQIKLAAVSISGELVMKLHRPKSE